MTKKELESKLKKAELEKNKSKPEEPEMENEMDDIFKVP